MGVTMSCKKTGANFSMGNGGFFRLRLKIAELHNKTFGEHYAKLPICSCEKDYEIFDKKTLEIIQSENLDIKIVDFCFQSDCDGKIRYGACKNIYNTIKDYDDEYAYTYAYYADKDFSKIKAIFKDCVDNKCDLVWY